MSPLVLDARGPQLLFSLFLTVYPCFFTFTYTFFPQKTPSLDASQLDARGRRAPHTPLCTPLLIRDDDDVVMVMIMMMVMAMMMVMIFDDDT